MPKEHEYVILGGLNRAQIGRYLAIAAASLSSIIVFVLLTLVDFAKSLGWAHNLPPVVMSMIGAGTVYTVLYWLFEKHFWKFKWVSVLLRVPNLAGTWQCEGQTINPDKTLGYKWQAKVTIIQSWDRLRVRLKTAQSGSNSIAAALTYDEADGFRLMYNYVNDPNIDADPEMKPHRGFAEFVFNKDLTEGNGTYFNGHGRFTFGTMRLTRESF